MPDALSEPLLTLAIPTYNRAARLKLLLDVLAPQLLPFAGRVQLIVADNASADETAQIIAEASIRYAQAGLILETLRNESNLGPDGNFLACLRAARGHFFWICGDDDIIVPGGLAEVMAQLQDRDGTPAELDMLYVTSYGFRGEFSNERQNDPYGRIVHTVTDVHRFVRIVHVLFTFVSGMVVNRKRYEQLRTELIVPDPSDFLGTYLIQLAWVLPLLLRFRTAKILWTRPLAVRQGHANSYSLGRVFGTNLRSMLQCLLPGRPDLYNPILQEVLRRWLPGTLLELRVSSDPTLRVDQAAPELRRAYGGDPLFWLFTYPVLALPLPLAALWRQVGLLISKVLYAVHVPGIRRP